MPRITQKRLLLNDLHSYWAFVFATEGPEEADEIAILIEAVREKRYPQPRILVPKSNFFHTVLPGYDEERFRSFARMDRSSFSYILGLIQNDTVFQNQSYTANQAPVESQLLLALYKLGHNGTGSGYRKQASHFGVSEGHVFKTTMRVVQAICRLESRFVSWPTGTQRRKESHQNDEREGFFGAVGKMDGTDIVLNYEPRGIFKGEHFYNRKGRYALDLMAICNCRKEFTYYLAGWPNSQHDASIFGHSNISKHPEQYFTEGEYLLADSAYPSTEWVVPPFKAPHNRQKVVERFNRKLSNVRIDIEHAFGMLKGRWSSLASLRLRLNTQSRYKFAVQWIAACVILHNILIQYNDEWSSVDGWWSTEEDENNKQYDEDIGQLNQHQGEMKRDRVMAMVMGQRSQA